MDLESYYDIVRDKLSQRGYDAAPDWYTVKEDFESGKTAEQSVEEFEEDWGDPGDEEF